MAGTKIDGVMIAQYVTNWAREGVEYMKTQGIQPCLATILVGDDQASATYVRNKHNACAKVGITTKDHKLDSDTTEDQVKDLVLSLNHDKSVHGILVQLPLPKQMDAFAVISAMSPYKDVDGLTPHNTGTLALRQETMMFPCTPSGIMEIFSYYNIDLEGKNAVIINRSNLVGMPLHNMLLGRNATVTICHSKTTNLRERCLAADIVITAVGDRARFTLTSDMIKEGAIVIDVAITKHEGRLTGDTDFDDIIQKASFATPVPGGVGPLTVAMLLRNTVMATGLNCIDRLK